MNFVKFFFGLGAVLTVAAVSQVQAFELVFESHSPASFAHPHDITLSPDQRYLYVADTNNDAIAVLDPTSLAVLGSFGKGEVSEPHDVVFQSTPRSLKLETSK